ncbi:MAG: serine protease AprX [Gaiellaceae bacterium]|nr:serine protease AprX [Gaiellaceae bacterium]
MARKTGGNCGDVRQSALWGSGNRGGEFRSNALWGKGGRGGVVTLVGVLVLSLAAGAASARGTAPQAARSVNATVVEQGLLERAQANPKQMFRVIVQSVTSAGAAESAFQNVEKTDDQQLQNDEKLAQDNEQSADKAYSAKNKSKTDRAKASAERDRWHAKRDELRALRNAARGKLDDRFDFINGVSLEISGRRLERLARSSGLTITEDVMVQQQDLAPALPTVPAVTNNYLKYTSKQLWAHESGVSELWTRTVRDMPAIAVVDSGIDTSLPDFAGRGIPQINFVTSGKPNGALDGRGHGSFVAGIAAGSAKDAAGVAPNAPLISLDVMDDSGSGRTSDVIAASEWIFQNHVKYDIGVVNYSLHGGGMAHFYDDPLNKAVSKLWHAGVVVVAAAGNYGKDGAPSGVLFAPGNNPFVITVGAIDIGGTAKVNDDDRAPWSAYGRTPDGFWKPEICAPGRLMVGPIPMDSSIAKERPTKIKTPGYIELSGTSFAAPVISGIAAQILARNPDMTPDQVKGAVLRRARAVPQAEKFSCGVGQVNAVRAVLNATKTSNPNAALNRFLKTDAATGQTVFDAVSWTDAVKANVSWDAVSWTDVSWSDVSWDAVSWSDVSWTDVSWTDVSWSDVSWEDAGSDTGTPDGSGVPLTPAQELAAAQDPDLAPLPDLQTPLAALVTPVVAPVTPVVAPVTPVAAPVKAAPVPAPVTTVLP